jgi:hypothetical protein
MHEPVAFPQYIGQVTAETTRIIDENGIKGSWALLRKTD